MSPEQERDPGRDERAERKYEDEQRQRNGEEPGLLQVVIERALDLFPGALAERPDVEGGVRLLHPGHRVDDRVDLVGRLIRRPADLSRDEHGVLVVGDLAAVVRVVG